MDVFGLDDQRHCNHSFRFLCPLFDHQEAVTKRRDSDPDQTGRVDEQLIDASVPGNRRLRP